VEGWKGKTIGPILHTQCPAAGQVWSVSGTVGAEMPRALRPFVLNRRLLPVGLSVDLTRESLDRGGGWGKA